MEVQKEESRQVVEQQFLSQAQSTGLRVLIGQMNKTEHEGIVRDIGRYEINLEENGTIFTLLKQEISYITAPHPLLNVPFAQTSATPTEQHLTDEPANVKPNIQQEFLDKAIRENQVLTLYLMNGQRFKATIEAYDNFTILLTGGGKQHLYYKHSITTINR